MSRGTVRKGMMAGVAAFMLGIFLAFSREYVVQARRREGETMPARKHGSKDTASAAREPV